MGQLGHLGRHFLKESHAKNFHQIFNTNQPTKESLAIQGTWWCLPTVPKPRTDYRSLRIDPGQKDELQCFAVRSLDDQFCEGEDLLFVVSKGRKMNESKENAMVSSFESQIENCGHEVAFPTLHNCRPSRICRKSSVLVLLEWIALLEKIVKQKRAKPVGVKISHSSPFHEVFCSATFLVGSPDANLWKINSEHYGWRCPKTINLWISWVIQKATTEGHAGQASRVVTVGYLLDQFRGDKQWNVANMTLWLCIILR